MTRLTYALPVLLVLGACGDSPEPYVYCDDDAVFPDVTALIQTSSVWIDATEVTQGQYRAFLDATGGGTDVGDQPVYCEWNTSYVPDEGCYVRGLADERMLDETLGCDSRPQTCVDWCDAYMYCQWAGKHLCGSTRSDPPGGRLSLELGATTDSEWYVACSSGGPNRYSPGEFEDVSRNCNVLECQSQDTCLYDEQEFPSGTVVAPGTMAGCQSPSSLYDGVYDLSGNVGEWDNSCDGETGPDDACAARGGNYLNALPCDTPLTPARSATQAFLGFRCCGDPADS